MQFQLASLMEGLVDAGPEFVCLVAGEVRHTRRSLDERANQVAHHLLAQGVEPGDRIGILTYNRAEHIETMLACWKISAVPVNLNYRYVASELVFVWNDAALSGVVAERTFAPVVGEVLELLDNSGEQAKIKVNLVIDDGSSAELPDQAISYDSVIAEFPTTRDFGVERSPDDLYLLYTGGTTGMPKGVLWRHEDIFFAAMGGGNYFDPISTPEEILINASEPPVPMNMLTTAPLMHASGQWVAMIAMLSGGKAVVYTDRSFDAASVLDLAAAEGSQTLSLIGDAMAIPVVDEMLANPRDLPDLVAVANGGTMLSPASRVKIAEAFPRRFLSDGFGSSETGTVGSGVVGDPTEPGSYFSVGPNTQVVDPDTLEPVPFGTRGMVARTGHIPLGYLNLDDRDSTTFRTSASGVRWVLSGDWAEMGDDGRMLLLGRDSTCINTGGEKVHPEEVEAACRTHPSVADVIVTGVPDPKWGSKVVAIVELDGGSDLDLEGLQEHCRTNISSYKLPRELILNAVQRTNIGKPDTAWASIFAREALDVD